MRHHTIGVTSHRDTQDLDEVMRLIDERLDVNEVDALGHTPLHVAAGSEEPNSGCFCECVPVRTQLLFSWPSVLHNSQARERRH